MTWTAPHAFVTSEVVTASTLNGLSDDLTFLGGGGGAKVDTVETTASLSFTDLATSGPAITMTTLTKAQIGLSMQITNNTSGDYAQGSYAVSGATTIPAGSNVLTHQADANVRRLDMGSTFYQSGLTGGSNVFTTKYTCVTGGTSTFGTRHITGEPMTS